MSLSLLIRVEIGPTGVKNAFVRATEAWAAPEKFIARPLYCVVTLDLTHASLFCSGYPAVDSV
jgi:hypothetical protein